MLWVKWYGLFPNLYHGEYTDVLFTCTKIDLCGGGVSLSVSFQNFIEHAMISRERA